MLTPHSPENINVSSPVGPIRNNTEERVEVDLISKQIVLQREFEGSNIFHQMEKKKKEYLSW